MTPRRWLKAALLAAAVACASPRAALAQATAAPTSDLAQANLSRYIQSLGNTLRQATPQQRAEAAQRLLEIATPDARQLITAGLSDGDDRTQLACARAIADHDIIDPAWLAGLVRLLGHDRPTTEAAARALARYEGNDAADSALIGFATDHNQPFRTAAIPALGQVVQKPVAEALVNVVNDPGEEEAARNAAIDALAHLSGQRAVGPEGRFWSQWWNARAARNPANWRAQVLAEQHPSLEFLHNRAAEQLRQFRDDVRNLLLDQYDHLPPADKQRALLGYLNNPDPLIRAIGAQIVPEELASTGQSVTPAVRQRLAELVGDASPEVRLGVAQALAALSDPTALNPILLQLQIERNPTVKIEMIKAIARTNEQAVPVLEDLMRDPSVPVAAVAADAIRTLAPAIQRNPALASRVAQELVAILRVRTGQEGQPIAAPGNDDLRAALVAAVAALASNSPPDEMLRFFTDLLSQNESPRTRVMALQGLAALRERAGDVIAHQLSPAVEPDPRVRAAAARALGEIGSFAYAPRLEQSMRPDEPDPAVRESAWQAFQNLLPLPSASARQLLEDADLFHHQNQLAHEAKVLDEACKKLASTDGPDLAIVQQRTGDVLTHLPRPQPEQAIPYFRQALDYWQRTGKSTPQFTDPLIGQLMNAYLASRQYQSAVRFGQEQVLRNPANVSVVGPAIRNTAERLTNAADAASHRDAAELIRAALAMEPPLDPTTLGYLEHFRDMLPLPPTTAPQG